MFNSFIHLFVHIQEVSFIVETNIPTLFATNLLDGKLRRTLTQHGTGTNQIKQAIGSPVHLYPLINSLVALLPYFFSR